MASFKGRERSWIALGPLCALAVAALAGCTTSVVIELRDSESHRPLFGEPLTVRYVYMMDFFHLRPDEVRATTDEYGRAYIKLRTDYPATLEFETVHRSIPIVLRDRRAYEQTQRPGYDDRFARDDFRNAPTSLFPRGMETEPGPAPWLPWVRDGSVEVLMRPPNPEEKSKFERD